MANEPVRSTNAERQRRSFDYLCMINVKQWLVFSRKNGPSNSLINTHGSADERRRYARVTVWRGNAWPVWEIVERIVSGRPGSSRVETLIGGEPKLRENVLTNIVSPRLYTARFAANSLRVDAP